MTMPITPNGPRPWRPAMQETRVYNNLFSLVDTERKDAVTRDAVWPLLVKSGIHFVYLNKIWQLVDPSGHKLISRRKFHMAMKLVSMAQSGRPLSLEHLGDATPLPAFDDAEQRSAVDSSSRSSLLRYSPQPTIDVDGLIVSAGSGSSLSSRSSRHRASPPLSRSSSIFEASGGDFLDTDRMAMVSPQLVSFSPTCLQPPPLPTSALHIDTSMRTLCARPSEASRTDRDQYSAVSTDSVTELLCQIDQMVSSSRSSHSQRSSNEHHANTVSLSRRELEEKMAQLQVMCEQELEMNASLANRLCFEEAQIKELTQHIERAQSNIAYVAWQRAQLVDRLQKVEIRQREATERMKEAEIETARCTEDVTMLDNKMFVMERRQVQILRRTKHSNSGYSSSSGHRVSSGSRSSAENTAMSRYESAKRNRLSSVFRSNNDIA
ncbi:hypothetical protein IWW39_001085 [Coemansia spiralis]|uniref:EH domain-containing protein n=1 Tax=Coemansia spiralis TaxID=417178 RepID=A0A9W8GJJ2_9FUNG|nr:hypothetical protein IWW39_001085 [Coemansia spiralis]